MAVLKVMAVRDRAVDAFGQPIFVVAIGVGVRSFSDEVNREGSPMNAHPEDYDLFLLGEFDDSIGLFVGAEPPRQVAIGKDMKRPETN